jgi:hypothetical protein
MNYSNISVSLTVLSEICNPYSAIVWHGVNSPIKKHEVTKQIRQGNLLDPNTIDPNNLRHGKRIAHIRRIAWFVVNGWSDPLEVDVGVPSAGCHIDWPVTDGNHRLAAAILRKDASITICFGGSVNYGKELGLLPKNKKRR